MVSPPNVWLLAVPALPRKLSVPPAMLTVEVFARMLLAGAPAAEKLSLTVPLLIVVAPV